MPRSHKAYPEEFKRKLVGLVREGRTPEELGRQFEPSAQAIRNWVVQADRNEGRRQDGLASSEREELQRLRRENERLRAPPGTRSRSIVAPLRFSLILSHSLSALPLPHSPTRPLASRPALPSGPLVTLDITRYSLAMSAAEELFEHVCREVIVGVVREDDASDAREISRIYVENGIRTLEITLTTPDALSLIAAAAQRYAPKGILIAAGTVRNGNDAADARRAGARILVSPHTDQRVIDYATENDLLCIAGAATPTEIIHAWEAGAGLIKIYPVPHLGGPEYFRTIRGPIRDIPMLAGGPVSIESIDAYLDAGALAVNLGGSLAVPDLVRAKKWDEIGRRVAMAVSVVRNRKRVAEAESFVH